jgi:dTDP-3-amino-3,4,6-trideoxy-alpha-D-glucose transaminase
VVEDATLALGASVRGAPVGALGDAAFFSFAPRKVLGGTGNGGLVATRDPALAARVRLLKGYGLDPRRGEAPIRERQTADGYAHLVEGHNLKLDPLQAAVVGAKLAHLDEWAAWRQRVADRYAARLSGLPGLRLPAAPPDRRHAWRNYVVRLSPSPRRRPGHPAGRRDRHQRPLRAAGPPPAGLPLAGVGTGQLPGGGGSGAGALCLPIYPGMTDDQVDEVAAALTAACATADHAPESGRDGPRLSPPGDPPRERRPEGGATRPGGKEGALGAR